MAQVKQTLVSKYKHQVIVDIEFFQVHQKDMVDEHPFIEIVQFSDQVEFYAQLREYEMANGFADSRFHQNQETVFGVFSHKNSISIADEIN